MKEKMFDINVKKEIIAIIPARSGSKGLRNKNILKINGKPLLQLTVDTALTSKLINRVIVDSDSYDYLNLIKDDSKLIKHKRNADLATDDSSVIDVITSIIMDYNNLFSREAIIVLLQVTSPLRTNDDIDNAIEKFLTSNLFINEPNDTSLVSISKAFNSANHFISLRNDIIDIKLKHQNRQQYSSQYVLNGAIYIRSINGFITDRSFFSKKTQVYLMQKVKSIDIDEEEDFLLVRKILEEKNEK